MRVLSIDHATRTGWSVIQEGKVTATGNFTLFVNESYLVSYYNYIQELIYLYKPDIICIEEPKHLRNAKILRYLISLYTIINFIAQDNKIEIKEVNPKAVKKYITGNGSSEKDIVMDCLINEWEVPKDLIFKPLYYMRNKDKIKSYYYDESDASANGLYCYNNLI